MPDFKIKKAIKDIINLLRKAQEIASKNGWDNIVQPGLVKEMIIADILGHEVHKTKHEPDAFEYGNPEIAFEYLTCAEGGTFQLDRVFKFPPEKMEKSLERITRNKMIYCAIFAENNGLKILEIWQVEVDIFLAKVISKLEVSSNDISHVSVSIKWVKQNGKKVFPPDSLK